MIVADNVSTQQEILMYVNAYRRQENLDPLYLSTLLSQLAHTRAKEASQSFSHTRPDGTTVKDLFPEKPCWLGENLLLTTIPEPKLIVRAWMESSTHRNNIMNRRFKRMGISIVNVDGRYCVAQILTD